MYRYVLTREADLKDGTPGWRVEQEEDHCGFYFGGPMVDFDADELTKIAATMEIGERKILEI